MSWRRFDHLFKNSIVDVARIEQECKNTRQRLVALERFNFAIPHDDFSTVYGTMLWPSRIDDASDLCSARPDELQIGLIDALERERDIFFVSLKALSSQVGLFAKYEDIQDGRYAEEAQILMDRLLESKAQVEDFEKREKVFDFKSSGFDELGEIMDDFAPYHSLWTIFSEFEFLQQALARESSWDSRCTRRRK